MGAPSKTAVTSAGGRPRIASAARSQTEPRRAGAFRVAVATMILAGAAATATFLGAQWQAERTTLGHLEGLRQAAQADLSRLLESTAGDVSALASDPQTAAALASFKDGIRNATVEVADQTPAALAPYQDELAAFYENEVLPKAQAAGRPATQEALYPDDGAAETPNPVVVLQTLFLATPDVGGDQPGASSPVERYAKAHGKHGPWLRDVLPSRGWENIHLIDDVSGTVLFSAVPTVETFTNLTEGVHRLGGLARASSRANAEPQPGDTHFADAAFGPVDAQPRVFVSAPVFSGERRVGTVVATIPTEAINQALLPGSGLEKWTRADLGQTGQILAVSGDGTLRSSPRAGVAPASMSPGLREALAGNPTTGVFEIDGEPHLASYGPVELGAHRWVVAVEQLESEAVGPLLELLPILLGIVVLAALAGWLIGARLWSLFAGQLRQISSVVQKVQRGDRQARLEVAQDGAVGELAASINRLLDDRAGVIERAETEQAKLSRDAEHLLEVARAAASGEAVGHADLHGGALSGVSEALNEMLDTIGTLSESLKRASTQVSTSASQIRASADETSTNAAQQTRVCSETESSAEALRTERDRIATQCSDALEVARRTEQATRSGQSALTDLLAGMEGLQRETRAATVKIKRLGERSMQISAIIGTISKMSAQTDMLALNAAIEASRAGEQGQGFTLVADEVRKLAERAAAAAKEIERLIGGIQADIGDAVGGMERQGERIEVQAAAATQAQHALERVGSVTSEASTTMEEIANTADAQAAAVEKLGEAVSQIATAATGVQRSSEQTRRSSTELTRLSDELRSQLATPAEA